MTKDELIEKIAVALGTYEIKNGGRPWEKKTKESQARYRRRAQTVFDTIAPILYSLQQKNKKLTEQLRSVLEQSQKKDA